MVRATRSSLSMLSFALALAACGSARNVAEGGGPAHPAGYLSTHGSHALADLASCRTCHGLELTGALGPSCDACHEEQTGVVAWQTNCTFCHGQERLAEYTAADLPGAAPSTGAHQKHVSGGLFGAAISCEQCHPPVASLEHVDGDVAVEFGSVATAGGVTPTWTAATGSCSSVYCHGTTLTGATSPDPTWTGAPLVCGSCHDLHPTSGEHVFHRTAPRSATCQTCHRGFGNIDLEHHVNGTGEAVLADGTTFATFAEPDCTACHDALGVVTP